MVVDLASAERELLVVEERAWVLADCRAGCRPFLSWMSSLDGAWCMENGGWWIVYGACCMVHGAWWTLDTRTDLQEMTPKVAVSSW